MPANYIFTWKPDHWPYEKLRVLIENFEAGQTVTEPWRCISHRRVRIGDTGFLLKQGGNSRGIFGVARVIELPYENDDAMDGEGRWMVKLQFERLVDPTKRFLVSEQKLRDFGMTDNELYIQASGIGLSAKIADQINNLIETAYSSVEESKNKNNKTDKRERLVEVYDRDQSKVVELRVIYGNKCQICDAEPFNGAFGKIVEGHHIQWLCRGGSDTIENMVLLCPNHHAAIHASDPSWDAERLEFNFFGKVVPIRLNKHLKNRSRQQDPGEG